MSVEAPIIVNALGWGMQNRLSRVFNPESGRTVMLAIDHGYFMGPTTGLERVDINIVPLLGNCTAPPFLSARGSPANGPSTNSEVPHRLRRAEHPLLSRKRVLGRVTQK